jgi:hypothetical protein
LRKFSFPPSPEFSEALKCVNPSWRKSGHGRNPEWPDANVMNITKKTLWECKLKSPKLSIVFSVKTVLVTTDRGWVGTYKLVRSKWHLFTCWATVINFSAKNVKTCYSWWPKDRLRLWSRRRRGSRLRCIRSSAREWLAVFRWCELRKIWREFLIEISKLFFWRYLGAIYIFYFWRLPLNTRSKRLLSKGQVKQEEGRGVITKENGQKTC